MTVLFFLGAASLMSSFLYGLHYVHQPQSLPRTICKTVPIGGLTVISFLTSGPVALTFALLLGTLGDIFLSRTAERNFLLGLGAFLVGHIFYIVLLAGLSGGITPFVTAPWRIIAALCLIAVAVAVTRRLLPHLGPLRVPVWIYVFVILCMGLVALTLPAVWPFVLAILGAILFIASDAILGFELFVFKDHPAPRRLPATVLWFLYWGGQCLIVLAVLLL